MWICELIITFDDEPNKMCADEMKRNKNRLTILWENLCFVKLWLLMWFLEGNWFDLLESRLIINSIKTVK